MKSLNPESMLELSREEMKSLGYRVVDMIVDHYETAANKRPVTHASRQEMDWLLQEPIPEQGMPINELLDEIEETILKRSANLGHPRWYSYCPSPSNIVSTFSDALATGFNIFTGAWDLSPGAAEVEILTMNWLLKLFGFPVVEGGGLFVSGGSMANLTAMTTARKVKLGDDFSKGVVYWSDQTHSSVARAAAVMGIHEDRIRVMVTDRNFRMDPGELRTQVERDLEQGWRPYLVVANAGTTNTGAVDPLDAVALICQHHDLWMHVDGAYGGAAILAPAAQAMLNGIERADSLTVDPHKWFFQPYEIGMSVSARSTLPNGNLPNDSRLPARSSSCGRRDQFLRSRDSADSSISFLEVLHVDQNVWRWGISTSGGGLHCIGGTGGTSVARRTRLGGRDGCLLGRDHVSSPPSRRGVV